MAVPTYFVNGTRIYDPPGGAVVCEMNPPFPQHMTLEILVHIPIAGIELRHYRTDGSIKQIVMCVNNDTIYLTVEPNERLVAHYWASVTVQMVQCSLYAWR